MSTLKFIRNMATSSIKVYDIGGFVRDEFMGLKSKDRDFTVVGPSYAAMKEFILINDGTIRLEKPEFLTIRAKLPQVKDADFVLARKEGSYSDGRHPDKVEMGTLLDDQKRRDFCVNSIARDAETGELFDPFDGLGDISYKLLRCVGKAQDRFAEDSLRLLRAIRFHIIKGFRLHTSINWCLNDSYLLNLLSNVSAERIMEELKKCFIFDTYKTFQVLNNYPHLSQIIFTREKPKMQLIPTLNYE